MYAIVSFFQKMSTGIFKDTVTLKVIMAAKKALPVENEPDLIKAAGRKHFDLCINTLVGLLQESSNETIKKDVSMYLIDHTFGKAVGSEEEKKTTQNLKVVFVNQLTDGTEEEIRAIECQST